MTVAPRLVEHKGSNWAIKWGPYFLSVEKENSIDSFNMPLALNAVEDDIVRAMIEIYYMGYGIGVANGKSMARLAMQRAIGL